MPGKYQGKLYQSVGTLLAFSLVQFNSAETVWSLLQLVSHIYGNKPLAIKIIPLDASASIPVLVLYVFKLRWERDDIDYHMSNLGTCALSSMKNFCALNTV